MGMYDTKKFFAHTQRFIFSLEKFDPDKTTIIFVHGVSGTPRDFKYLVDGLDKTRYQPVFYFYPSGMPLQKLGSFLSDIMTVLEKDKYFHVKKAIVVAHSMGGLVSFSALNELFRNGVPAYLKGYISFNSPYGGVESAKKALEKAPAVLDSWRDVAPGSPFLENLYQGSAAEKIPFYLFFGYETGDSSDGTITLQSQLEHRIQFAAKKTYGFNASHVGILNDDQARQTFYRVLEVMDEGK
jgi:pimeloyl-ACP methyl ester carboxylesterase